MTPLVHNERMKLAAVGLNNIGVAMLAAGIFGPLSAFIYGTSTAETYGWWLMDGLFWIFSGVGIHMAGQAFLGRLQS